MAEGAGFFARLANLWKGFVSLWISDIEKEHPEIAYENAINSMIEKYSQAQEGDGGDHPPARGVSTSGSRRSARSWPRSTAELNVAVETNQDDLARRPDPEEEPARRRRSPS